MPTAAVKRIVLGAVVAGHYFTPCDGCCCECGNVQCASDCSPDCGCGWLALLYAWITGPTVTQQPAAQGQQLLPLRSPFWELRKHLIQELQETSIQNHFLPKSMILERDVDLDEAVKRIQKFNLQKDCGGRFVIHHDQPQRWRETLMEKMKTLKTLVEKIKGMRKEDLGTIRKAQDVLIEMDKHYWWTAVSDDGEGPDVRHHPEHETKGNELLNQ